MRPPTAPDRHFLSGYRNVTRGSYKETFHAHPELEFCYVHEGNGDLWLDGKHDRIGPGTLLFFQPFQLHRVQMQVSEEAPFIRTVIAFKPELLEDALSPFPMLQSFYHHLVEDHLSVQVLNGWVEDDLAIRHLAHGAEQMPSLSAREREEEKTHILITFLRLVQQRWKTHEQMESLLPRNPHRAEQIIKWIDAHYHEEFRMERMIRDLYLSGSHLSHLFREATGNTISDYLMAKRMREACRLLVSTSHPIPELGCRVGLTNPSYFCQAFKKKLGVSPHQYRLINRKV